MILMIFVTNPRGRISLYSLRFFEYDLRRYKAPNANILTNISSQLLIASFFLLIIEKCALMFFSRKIYLCHFIAWHLPPQMCFVMVKNVCCHLLCASC